MPVTLLVWSVVALLPLLAATSAAAAPIDLETTPLCGPGVARPCEEATLRDETHATVLNANGSRTWVAHPLGVPLHYRDATGAWQRLRKRFRDDGAGGWVADELPYTVQLNANGLMLGKRGTAKHVSLDVGPLTPAADSVTTNFGGMTWIGMLARAGLEFHSAPITRRHGKDTLFHWPIKRLGLSEFAVQPDGSVSSDDLRVSAPLVIGADERIYRDICRWEVNPARLTLRCDDRALPDSALPYTIDPVWGWAPAANCYSTGSGTVWVYPTRAESSNNLYASALLSASGTQGATSQYLACTDFRGMTAPPLDALITQVEAYTERKGYATTSISTAALRVVKGGVVDGTERKGNDTAAWPSTDEVRTLLLNYCSTTTATACRADGDCPQGETCNGVPFVPYDLTLADTGFALAAANQASVSRYAYVDYLALQVTYTSPTHCQLSGFDISSPGTWTGGTCPPTTSGCAAGGACLQCAPGGATSFSVGPATGCAGDPFTASLRFKVTTLPTSGGVDDLVASWVPANFHRLRVASTGALVTQYYSTSTGAWTDCTNQFSSTIAANQWYRLVARYGSNGVRVWWLKNGDGTSIEGPVDCTTSAVDARLPADLTLGAGESSTTLFDDLDIDSGTADPGNIHIKPLLPTGDSVTGWTSTGASHYTEVDDPIGSLDGNATKIYASTTGVTDTFGHQTCAGQGISAPIHAVSESLRLNGKLTATVDGRGVFSAGNGYGTNCAGTYDQSKSWELRPYDQAAWTTTNLDSATIGVTARDSNGACVTQMGLEVAYIEPDRDQHADQHVHAYFNTHGDANADGDEHGHTDADQYLDRYTDEVVHAHAHGHSNAHEYRDDHTDRYPQRDADPDQHAHLDPNGDADPHTNRNANRHADRDTNRDGYRNPVADADRDRHGDGHRDRKRHSHRDADADLHAHLDPNSDAHTHADRDGDRYGDGDPNGHRHSDAHRDADRHRYRNGHRDRKHHSHCDRHAAPEPHAEPDRDARADTHRDFDTYAESAEPLHPSASGRRLRASVLLARSEWASHGCRQRDRQRSGRVHRQRTVHRLRRPVSPRDRAFL